jgi:hypothetical protein
MHSALTIRAGKVQRNSGATGPQCRYNSALSILSQIYYGNFLEQHYVGSNGFHPLSEAQQKQK